MSVVWAVSGLALLVVGIDYLIQRWQTVAAGRAGETVLFQLRLREFAHLQRLGLDYYERELAGRIMTRMTTDVDALSSFLQTGLVTSVVSLATFAGIAVLLVVMDAGLALIAFTAIPFLIVATVIFRRISSRAYTDAREKVSVVNADLQENVAGLRVSQALGREQSNAEGFAARSDAYRRSRMRAQTAISVYFPFVALLSELAAALVLWFGANRLVAGTVSAGTLLAFVLYLDFFFTPIQQLSQVFDGYQQATVGLRRIGELLDTPTSTPPAATRSRSPGWPATSAPTGSDSGTARRAMARAGTGRRRPAHPARQHRRRGRVHRRRQVDAGQADRPVLRRHRRCGAGGRHRRPRLRPARLPAAARRGAAGTTPVLRDGARQHRLRPPGRRPTPRWRRAARSVGAIAAISGLTGGFTHRVDERGRNLSAGQRQLISLARAELVDPDILLLDEATAALDPAAEAAVLAATDRLAKGRTTVVVAHRLTTASRADRIVVMDHGRVVEDGTHVELLAAGGHYARLYAQS